MVAPFYGHRDLPPVPRAGAGWRFLLVCALLVLFVYWLWRDADEHYAHYRNPVTPAVCDLTSGKPCRIETTTGQVEVWQSGMGGIYGATVGTPAPTRPPQAKRDN